MTTRLITQTDHGKTVSVRKGDTVTLQLPENPTTGYRWSLDQHDPSALEPMQKPSFEPGGPALGAGGGRTFTFLAKTSGESDLALNLRRPWEDRSSAQNAFRVKVQIHD
jgi:inhibitor of cysteine peptidase